MGLRPVVTLRARRIELWTRTSRPPRWSKAGSGRNSLLSEERPMRDAGHSGARIAVNASICAIRRIS